MEQEALNGGGYLSLSLRLSLYAIDFPSSEEIIILAGLRHVMTLCVCSLFLQQTDSSLFCKSSITKGKIEPTWGRGFPPTRYAGSCLLSISDVSLALSHCSLSLECIFRAFSYDYSTFPQGEALFRWNSYSYQKFYLLQRELN